MIRRHPPPLPPSSLSSWMAAKGWSGDVKFQVMLGLGGDGMLLLKCLVREKSFGPFCVVRSKLLC